MALVSKELFELTIVWNAGPYMHILMIKFIPFYGDITHLDEFTAECEEMEHGVCALPIIRKEEREEDCLSVSKRNYSYRCAL